MSLRFDAAVKYLVEGYALDWARRFGLPAAEEVEVIDADVATVSATADRVIRVVRPTPCLIHLELQSSRDPTLPIRLLKYNVLLHERHRLPVLSVAILLRPSAELTDLTGVLDVAWPDGANYLRFAYHVVRLWREPPDTVLSGSVGLLPLAPLTNVTQDALPGVVNTLAERFRAELPEAQARTLWTSTAVLMGLRYPEELIVHLLRGVGGMEESVIYQRIAAEGEAKGRLSEARRILVRVASKHFGPPDDSTRSILNATHDIERLERLAEKVSDVNSWTELLAEA